MDKYISKRNTIILVGLLTLWRLYLSAELQLHPDEAYYWLWSRHLDIGYFDHSPLVAYFIWFTTLHSESELWVRLSGTIVSLILSFLTWQLAMQLFGSVRVAAGSVMLFNAFPMTVLGLMVMTPDIPVYLFWSLSVYIFWQIIRSNHIWLWYALGISFGLALLSKYTAILLAPCLLIYLLSTEDRRWLKTPYPYLALLIGLLCFLPVVYWNSRHDWISFAFQFGHGLGGHDYSLDRLVEYIGGQLIVAGPFVWLLGMYAALACLFRKNKAQLFLILTAFPVIVFFGVSSLKKLAGPNWPAFAYFSFSILITKYFLDSASKTKRALWCGAIFSSLLISAVVTLHARFNLLPLARFSKAWAIADATNSFYGWRELGAEINKYPGMEFAVTPSHQLCAEIMYYTNAKIFVQADQKLARPSQFSLWVWPNELAEKNGMYIWTEGEQISPYKGYVNSTTEVISLSIFRAGIAVRDYRIIPGKYSTAPTFTVHPRS